MSVAALLYRKKKQREAKIQFETDLRTDVRPLFYWLPLTQRVTYKVALMTYDVRAASIGVIYGGTRGRYLHF